MIQRVAHEEILRRATMFPVVSLTGPRQSGKTTLARQAFPDFTYISFEDPETRILFENDPRGFLARYNKHVIFDEAQRVPDLFSYIQGVVDEANEPGQFIITGSQNFLLLRTISQSLAGRVALFTLLPLSYQELASSGSAPEDPLSWVLKGGYPRLYSSKMDLDAFFPSYIKTYLERDVRDELGVRSISTFETFLRLCAFNTGNLLNVTALASDCGIDSKTARGWLSILEASHIIYLLQPHFSNARKRLTKTPKLYFLDTGLACSLIGLDSTNNLFDSKQYGNLFETAVIAEVLKTYYAQGITPQLSYWRDSNKTEVDLLIEKGLRPVKAIEIKSSSTYNSKFFDTLESVCVNDLGLGPDNRAVIYGGKEPLNSQRGNLFSWNNISEVISAPQTTDQ